MARGERSEEAAAWFEAVCEAIQEVPYGKVTSYGHIARLVGKREHSLIFIPSYLHTDSVQLSVQGILDCKYPNMNLTRDCFKTGRGLPKTSSITFV